jgi:adenylate cyclase
MTTEKVERRLAAIVSADVVAYARLTEADEAGTRVALEAHRRELIDPKLAEHGGRLVSTAGDSLLVEFESAVEAVQCAVEVQRGMTRYHFENPTQWASTEGEMPCS